MEKNHHSATTHVMTDSERSHLWMLKAVGKFVGDPDIHQVCKYHPTDYPHKGIKETSLEKSGGPHFNITPNGTI